MEGRAVTCPPPRRRPSWRPLACFTVNSRCPRPESAPPPPPPRFPYRVKFPFCATPPPLCDPLKQVSKHQRKGIETEQKANGRPCCLGDRIDSIPCCACYFAPGWLGERDEFFVIFISSRYNSSVLHIVIVQFILFKSSLCKIASVARNLINSAPQAAVTTFVFSSVFILLPWSRHTTWLSAFSVLVLGVCKKSISQLASLIPRCKKMPNI